MQANIKTMAKIMMSSSLASQRHLAGILQGYLNGENWCTAKILEGHIYKSHSVEELRETLNNPIFAYLHKINPERLQYINTKFAT
jgi:hypothetical protein